MCGIHYPTTCAGWSVSGLRQRTVQVVRASDKVEVLVQRHPVVYLLSRQTSISSEENGRHFSRPDKRSKDDKCVSPSRK